MTPYQVATLTRALSRAGLPRELVSWCSPAPKHRPGLMAYAWYVGLPKGIVIWTPSGRLLGAVWTTQANNWTSSHLRRTTASERDILPDQRWLRYNQRGYGTMPAAVVALLSTTAAGV